MKAKELLFEFYDPRDDQSTKADMSDTRRPRLTLRHLHKLRKMRDIELVDEKNRDEFIKTMYGASSGE